MIILKVGKFADLVLWKPAFFGAKPEIIVKGGQIAWAQMGKKNFLVTHINKQYFIFQFLVVFSGMPNASIPTPQPVKQRKQFGAYGKAVGENSVVFVSQVQLVKIDH